MGYHLGRLYVIGHQMRDNKVTQVKLMRKFDAHSKPITGIIVNEDIGKEKCLNAFICLSSCNEWFFINGFMIIACSPLKYPLMSTKYEASVATQWSTELTENIAINLKNILNNAKMKRVQVFCP